MDGPQLQPTPLLQKVNAVWAGRDRQYEFQKEVAALLRRSNARHFPGAQPVSFTRDHLEELRQHDYYVCEKTDGLRYLMYLTHDDNNHQVVYLIDRKNDYWWVPHLYFPHHENDKDMTRFARETIIDGELVEDRFPDGSRIMKYLAFDLLTINGKDMRDRHLDKRLGHLKQFILEPLKRWKHLNPQARLPFTTEDKKTEFSDAIPRMFDEIIPQVKLLHGNDGLIFTCKETPYESGTDHHILKWKPPEENTVDFLMHIEWQRYDDSGEEDYDSMPLDVGLYIYEGGNMDYSHIGSLYITPDEWENMKAREQPLQDCIVECFLEQVAQTNGHTNGHLPESTRWRYHRFRDDKEEANHSSTFVSVQQSIEDHVTQQDLLDHSEPIRAARKARQARRPSRPQ